MSGEADADSRPYAETPNEDVVDDAVSLRGCPPSIAAPTPPRPLEDSDTSVVERGTGVPRPSDPFDRDEPGRRCDARPYDDEGMGVDLGGSRGRYSSYLNESSRPDTDVAPVLWLETDPDDPNGPPFAQRSKNGRLRALGDCDMVGGPGEPADEDDVAGERGIADRFGEASEVPSTAGVSVASAPDCTHVRLAAAS